jgi:hypothetical protein
MLRVENINVDYFVYDLEFIGDVTDTPSCKIWEISILCVATKETCGCVIDPDRRVRVFPPPAAEGLFNLTRSFLTSKNAVDFGTNWKKIVGWVSARSSNAVVLISHNNFCSDKPVLENHFLQYHSCIPYNWYFFDSLHYFRDNLKTYDYSLKGLVRLLLNTTHEHAHRAKEDTIKLFECIDKFTNKTWKLTGLAYIPYTSSLRKIQGVGASVERALMSIGYTCEEQFLGQAFESIRRNGLGSFVGSTLRGFDIPDATLERITFSILKTALKVPLYIQ